MLIKNLCKVYILTEDELLHPIIVSRCTFAIDQLSIVKKGLPTAVIEAIEKNVTDEQIHQEAENMVNRKVSRADFLSYQSVMGKEWVNKVQTLFAHTEEGDALYDRIVGDIVTRLSMAHMCWKTMTADVAKLRGQIAEMENTLSNLGIFSFGAKKQLKQQIEDAKVELRKREAVYQHEKKKF